MQNGPFTQGATAGGRLIRVIGACGGLLAAIPAAMADELPRMPNFLASGHVPVLASAHAAPGTSDEAILRSADEARRRAEEERLKAVEIRRQAEALSQRFAVEIPATDNAAADNAAADKERAVVQSVSLDLAARPAAGAAVVTTGSIAKAAVEPQTAAVRARQAEAELAAAREALARARTELEEATRRAQDMSVAPRAVAEVDGAMPETGHDSLARTAKHAKSVAHKGSRPVVAKPQGGASKVAAAVTPTAPPQQAAGGGSSIAGPTMGLGNAYAASASSDSNPLAGLFSKVFGGGDSNPPVAAFNGQ